MLLDKPTLVEGRLRLASVKAWGRAGVVPILAVAAAPAAHGPLRARADFVSSGEKNTAPRPSSRA